MNDLMLIFIAVAVALAVWGGWLGIAHLIRNDRKRLQQRLTGEGADVPQSVASRNVTLASALPETAAEKLGQTALLRGLYKSFVKGYPEGNFGKFLTILGTIAMLGFVIVTLVMDSILSGLAAFGLVSFAGWFVVNNRAAARLKSVIVQLPEALDFLSRVLRAGHSLSTGIQMMGEELPQPLAAEFARCYDQHSLGLSLEEAMKEMARRIEQPDFAFFVTAVLIQRQTGGDLSEVLSNIATMVRQRVRLQQHVRAITAEGRLTSYILVAFPGVLFGISYTLNPDYAGILLRTNEGRLMLGASIFLQLIGLMVIRKIVTVKV